MTARKMMICPKKDIANQRLKIVCGALTLEIVLRGFALEKK